MTATAGDRAVAALLDGGLLVAPWVAGAAGVGAVLRALDAVPSTPAGQDLLAFAALVLPVTVHAGWCESRRGGGATPGKARRRLVVVDAGGGPPSLGRALVRSAVRYAPWQVAHTAVFRLVAGSESPGWLVASGLAQAAVVASWVSIAVRGRSLHDLATGTRVVPDDRAAPVRPG